MSGVLVHEWLEPVGGAERVVDALLAEFPDAPLTVPWNDAPRRYSGERVRESWLAHTPLRRHKALAAPVLMQWWRTLPAVDADWMLCGSHLFAHHARMRGAGRDVPKYVFAYSPARYLWARGADARGDAFAARAVGAPLRRIDRARAQEAVKIATVSAFIARRVEQCWGREATVIHPPVDVHASDDDMTQAEQARLAALPDTFLLGASRFVAYKRLDVVIQAGMANDLPVVLAGDGPDRPRLAALAAENAGRVTFIDHPSDGMLRALYRRALAYVFAPVEDFGIMPVEAMAAGTPVVANAVGGASETVIDGVTGALLHSTDPTELRRAVTAAAGCDASACRTRADDFDGSTFGARMRAWIAG